MDEIVRLREKIDRIDQEILVRLKARSEAARYIGQVKRARGLAIKARDREQEILFQVRRNSLKLGLNPVYARDIFRDILRLGIDAQQEPEPPTLSGLQCLVIGGTGEMGRLFAQILMSQGAQVRIAGRTTASAARAAQQIGAKAGRVEDARGSDIVIVSVPLQSTVAVARKAARSMPPGSILADLASVKDGIGQRIADAAPRTVEYVSLHPLFGSQATILHGQNMLFVPYRHGVTWRRLSKAFKAAGLILVPTTIEKHDQNMAYVQVMHHFALISLGSSLGEWDGRYSTNSLRLTLDRVQALVQNHRTIASIQEFNPNAAKARASFLSVARNLAKADGDGFESALARLSPYVQKWSRKR